MPSHKTPTPTMQPPAPVSAHQFDLVLHHPRLKGLTQSERPTVVTQLARLMLEARGLAGSGMQEAGDEHA